MTEAGANDRSINPEPVDVQGVGELVPLPPPDRPGSSAPIESFLTAVPVKRAWIIRFLSHRYFWYAVIFVAVIALLVWSQAYRWQQTPENPLAITIMNKTAAKQDRREHRGLYWLLAQNKFTDPALIGERRWYDYERDYVGYLPVDPPDKRLFSELEIERLEDRDLLYLTDSYGVYIGDYYRMEEDWASTELTPKIYGGLQESEVEAVEWFAQQGRTIIAEFNTFASPTPEPLRGRMEQLLGVTWTGWVGRYFMDFQDEKDVPAWIIKIYNYQQNSTIDLEDQPATWDEEGAGFIFFNEHGNLTRPDEPAIIVLNEGLDIVEPHLEFIPRDGYMLDDVMRGVEASSFNYWFDVVEPDPDCQVLADFIIHLTAQGRHTVTNYGLDLTFPAVVRQSKSSNPYRSYYFCGDMTDFSKPMGPPDSYLTLYINRDYYKRPVTGSQGYFFWHSFYPMVTNILRVESNELTGQPEDVYLFEN